jgi:hypothetical protein
LFICGAQAAPATEALVAALDDSDLKVKRLAAASLSMIGPPAHKALPRLATLRNASDELLRVWVAEAEARIGHSSPPEVSDGRRERKGDIGKEKGGKEKGTS